MYIEVRGEVYIGRIRSFYTMSVEHLEGAAPLQSYIWRVRPPYIYIYLEGAPPLHSYIWKKPPPLTFIYLA